MKRLVIFWLTAGLTFCLAACHGEPMATPTPTPQITEPSEVEVTPEPTPEPTPTPAPEPFYTGPWPDTQVPVSLLDLSSYEGELSGEEWEALQGFFPVLNNEVPMLAAHLSSGEEGVTPTEEVFFRDIYEAYAPKVELPSNYHLTMSFTLTPIVGEKPDLTFAMDGLGGWYLLIHREGERFYAVYMPVRWFEMLQTDGLYLGSGGAATAYYHRLRFSEGTFTEKLLANTDWGEWNEDGSYSGYYAIGGIQVTEAEFESWREDILTKDAVWYPARARRLEPWQAAYIEILSGYDARQAEFAPDIQGIYEENYAIYDIDKNGLPELFLIEGFSEASRICHVYFWQDGFAVEAEGHQEGYIEGSLDFWHGSLSTCPGENGVLWSQGRSYNKVRLVDGNLVGDSLDEMLPKDISTDKITAELFVPDTEGLCCYEPSDLQPILDYVLPLTPWQAAYWDILSNPEKYEEFYAVAEHVPSDSGRSVERIMNEDEPYYFAVWDVNEDGMPELLLGYGQHYGSPRVLLNILRYNEETGQIEDLDGTRTYPLMNSLHFYSNGFFDTHNSAGGLYTECWRLDDEEPDHYWYGYERSAQFDGDGELILVEEFPFYSSDGEKYTLQEYYELRGERIIDPFWQENTKERALAALLIVTGTEN